VLNARDALQCFSRKRLASMTSARRIFATAFANSLRGTAPLRANDGGVGLLQRSFDTVNQFHICQLPATFS